MCLAATGCDGAGSSAGCQGGPAEVNSLRTKGKSVHLDLNRAFDLRRPLAEFSPSTNNEKAMAK